MVIDDALIDKLANLSRLQFTEAEKSALKADFGKMLRFVDKLNELDTTGVEPMQHITGNINVLREDEAAIRCSREDALVNAPIKDEQFFNVPKVIKK